MVSAPYHIMSIRLGRLNLPRCLTQTCSAEEGRATGGQFWVRLRRGWGGGFRISIGMFVLGLPVTISLHRMVLIQKHQLRLSGQFDYHSSAILHLPPGPHLLGCTLHRSRKLLFSVYHE